ncbi:MAG TPA: ester cyclase [Ktedonobacteraceae bacterium]|nr:ester cyclase [Ktedonobacteraceae bacterium]
MSIEENKAMDRRFYEEVWNGGNLAVVDEFVAANYVDHDPQPTGAVEGVEGIKQSVTMYRTAFPDAHFTIEDQIAEGDLLVTRWRARGTHQGPLMGIPPTGKPAMVTGISITRWASGKVVEGWTNFDALGLLQQLGAVPSMG